LFNRSQPSLTYRVWLNQQQDLEQKVADYRESNDAAAAHLIHFGNNRPLSYDNYHVEQQSVYRNTVDFQSQFYERHIQSHRPVYHLYEEPQLSRDQTTGINSTLVTALAHNREMHASNGNTYSLYLQLSHNQRMHALNGNTLVDFDDSLLKDYQDISNYQTIVDHVNTFLYREKLICTDYIVIHRSFEIADNGFFYGSQFHEVDWSLQHYVLLTSDNWLILSPTCKTPFQSKDFHYYKCSTTFLTTFTTRIFAFVYMAYSRRTLCGSQLGCTVVTFENFNRFCLLMSATDRSQNSLQNILQLTSRRADQLAGFHLPQNTLDVVYVYFAHSNYIISQKILCNSDYLHKNNELNKELYPTQVKFCWSLVYYSLTVFFVVLSLGYLFFDTKLFANTFDSTIDIQTTSFNPTPPPTFLPTALNSPTVLPTDSPTVTPSMSPTFAPSWSPSTSPTTSPIIVIMQRQLLSQPDINIISSIDQPYIIFVVYVTLCFLSILIIYYCFHNTKNSITVNGYIIAKIQGLCMAPVNILMKPGFKIDIVPSLCTVHKTFGYVYGPAVHQRLSVCEACPENLHRAFVGRQAKHFDVKMMGEKFIIYCRKFHRIITAKPIEFIDPDIWALRFGGSKSRVYLDEIDKLRKGGEVDNDLEAFVKLELLTKAELAYLDTDHDPRLITASKPSFTVAMGPPSYSFAKHFYNAFTLEEHGIVFASGYNKTQLGELFDRIFKMIPDWVILTADNKRHDAHVNYYHLLAEFEAKMVAFDGEDDEYMKRFLKIFNRKGKGRARAIWYFIMMLATRHTGNNNTSDGNGYITLTSHDFVLEHFWNVDDMRRQRKFITVILGDNVFQIFSKTIAIPSNLQYDTILTETGMECESHMMNRDDFDFCSNLFVPSVEGSVATQYPGKNFCKAYATVKKYNYNQAMFWIQSQAKAYSQDFSHIPIMSDFHNQVLKITQFAQKARICPEDSYYGIVKHTAYRHTNCESTNQWFTRRYNFNYTENIFSHCTTLHQMQNVLDTHLWVKIIVDRDLGDQFNINQLDKKDPIASNIPKFQYPLRNRDGGYFEWNVEVKRLYDENLIMAKKYYSHYVPVKSAIKTADIFATPLDLHNPLYQLPEEQKGGSKILLHDDKIAIEEPIITKPCTKQTGAIYYVPDFISYNAMKALDNAHSKNHKFHPVVVFGDHQIDFDRNANQERTHLGGQASVMGPFDRTVAFGIPTVFHQPITDDVFHVQVDTLCMKLLTNHLNMGQDVIIPSLPRQSLLDSQLFSRNKVITIFHTLGSDIAGMSYERRLYLQTKFNWLHQYASIVHFKNYGLNLSDVQSEHSNVALDIEQLKTGDVKQKQILNSISLGKPIVYKGANPVRKGLDEALLNIEAHEKQLVDKVDIDVQSLSFSFNESEREKYQSIVADVNRDIEMTMIVNEERKVQNDIHYELLDDTASVKSEILRTRLSQLQIGRPRKPPIPHRQLPNISSNLAYHDEHDNAGDDLL